MEEEFEVTYLAGALPENFKESESREILDIYIPTTSEHPSLRIRKSGDKIEITKKQPVKEGDASHQMENTIPLTAEEFVDLEKLTGKRVRKIRYYYSEDGTDYEIDVFQDGLEGLVLVDVEFTSNEEKAKFIVPSWFGGDVTQEKFVAGGMICGKVYEDIQEDLDRFNYSPIE